MRNGYVAIAMVAALACAVTAGAPLSFTTIDRGQQSNIDTAGEVVVRTAAEWATLWRRHASEGMARPAVDFTRSTVVAVFLGSRPTGGFALDITRIEREGTALIVTYREERPKPDAILSQALTMPYHIVRIAKFAGPIRFKRVTWHGDPK